MRDGALEREYFAELALDRENAGRRHAAANGQDVFAGEFNHEVTTTSRLVLERVGLIEEHLVRTKGPVRWPNRTADESVEISEVRVCGEGIRGEQNEIMRICDRGIRHEDKIPLTEAAHVRQSARLRAAAALMALSRATSAAVSSSLKGFRADAGGLRGARRRIGLERRSVLM